MSDTKEDEFARVVRDGIIAAQMYAMPAFFVLRELIADVARLHPNPDGYVSDLYDRVAARLDPKGSASEKEVMGQSRDMLGSLFRDALSRTQDPNHRPGEGGGPRQR